MPIDADGENEPLDLTTEQEIGFADEQSEQTEQQTEPEAVEETVITFGDEDAAEEDETPLVKRLRDQLRQAQRANRQRNTAADNGDPEPVIPPRKPLEAFDYDQDKFDEAQEAREQAIRDHAAWERRQSEREAARKRAEEEEAKQVEQQVKSLGVSDYMERAAAVRDRLSDQQMAVLINAADNKAKLLYALGRSETKLDELASIDNLAKFAARIGQLEKEIKVTKRQAPAPESRVRGATASTAVTSDEKEIERLEREAERTGDRSKVIAYRRQMAARDAA